jgi:stage V sporulation protein SpoVS
MFDPSDDFTSVTDALEAVTVRRPGSSAVAAVAHALRQAVRTREAERSEGRYTAGDVVWHLPAAEIAEPPRPGDVIVDAAAERWTVLEVAQATLRSRWRCVARNLAVFHGLDDYIDLERAEFAKGQGGADEPAWHVWKAGLRARIQPATADVQIEHERQTLAARFKVFLADEVTIDHALRIRGPGGAIYAITGYRKAETIDALLEIDALRMD